MPRESLQSHCSPVCPARYAHTGHTHRRSKHYPSKKRTLHFDRTLALRHGLLLA